MSDDTHAAPAPVAPVEADPISVLTPAAPDTVLEPIVATAPAPVPAPVTSPTPAPAPVEPSTDLTGRVTVLEFQVKSLITHVESHFNVKIGKSAAKVDEPETAEARVARLTEAVRLLEAQIKSGQGWTDDCENAVNAALPPETAAPAPIEPDVI